MYFVDKCPVLYNLPDMYERTIIVSTGGKTFHCTGWKIGWAVSTKQIIQKMGIFLFLLANL